MRFLELASNVIWSNEIRSSNIKHSKFWWLSSRQSPEWPIAQSEHTVDNDNLLVDGEPGVQAINIVVANLLPKLG